MTTDTGITAYQTLGADINKKKTDKDQETQQGAVSEKLLELTLDLSNEELVKLTDKWEKIWKDSPKKTEWEKQIEENEKYWLGKQFDSPKLDDTRAMVDNLIFESLETYLPQATRRNPEPLVKLSSSEETSPAKEQYIQKVKGKLSDLSDANKIRLKLKKAGRHWAIYQLGVAKFGWDLDRDIPIVRIVRPKRIILDPDATIDEDGYTGERVGEYRKMEASKLLEIIKSEKDSSEATKTIDDLINKEELGTEINFQEWWTPQYICWKLNKTILLKKKNPHWNYDKTENPAPTDMSSEGVQVDNYGNTTANPIDIKGINHLPSPRMPYIFLSIFNLGDQPMDKTSLIGQNLSNQDLINKRNKQIDKNADRMNGGMVVSLARSGLTQPQAKMVTESLRKGGVVAIPDGSPSEAIQSYAPPALPGDVFSQLLDTRGRLRDIFGVKGSSQAGIESEKTVRGKIIGRSLDTDRIGGGVTEYLEQFADDIYNWFVQLLYVYDSDFQFVQGAIPPKITVSVKEGSLLPKDSTSIANQALELANINRISNIDLYKRLEWPNPEELAANIWLEVNAPQLLFRDNPLVQEAIGMQQQVAIQKATEDQQKKTEDIKTKQQINLENEAMKGEVKNFNKERSILSAVPQG